MLDDEKWMQAALAEARKADRIDEVPVGAVLVRNGTFIAGGYNRPISANNPLAHAELEVLSLAGCILQNYRLYDCELYVTIEPCMMCAGALVHSRIRRLIYGAKEPKAGAIVSTIRALELPHLNHYVEVSSGILAKEAAQLLQNFFQKKRQAK